MLTKHSVHPVLRRAAVGTAAVLFTMGAAPAYAGSSGGPHGHAAASHASKGAGHSHGSNSRTTHREASRPTASGRPEHAHRHGHTPVTVCHLLGNGSYHLLTFDDNALRAHLRHGDLYPVPAEGCPAAAATSSHGRTHAGSPGREHTVPSPSSPARSSAVAAPAARPAAVLGVERVRSGSAVRPAAVQAVGTAANRAPAQAAPTGVLPQTGAGRLGLALLAGLGMLGTGLVTLYRRRSAA